MARAPSTTRSAWYSARSPSTVPTTCSAPRGSFTMYHGILHKLTTLGDVDGVRSCLRAGVDPNEEVDEATALFVSLKLGHLKIARALLSRA